MDPRLKATDGRKGARGGGEPFLWGVATSGYQHQGGYNGPGHPHNNWCLSDANGTVMRTGCAADFWHRYAEDFTRCRDLDLNAFPLSLEWPRIQPTPGTESG